MIKTKCWDQNEKSTKCKDQKCIYALFILNKDLLLAGFFCTWILKKKKKICGMYLDGLWVYANFFYWILCIKIFFWVIYTII